MADVFISYKSEERSRVAPLAATLESRGYTVWWDLELVAGEKWKRRIKAELDAAKCVIVAWTARSVGADGFYTSEWIEKEAEDAHARGVLVPVLFDAERVAWDHKQLQYADLTAWAQSGDTRPLPALFEAVQRLCGVRQPPPPSELAAWTATEAARDAGRYRSFLAEFPGSRFALLADDRARELEEAEDWRVLGTAASAPALRDFLGKWPARRFAPEAQARLRALGGSRKRWPLFIAGAALAAVLAIAFALRTFVPLGPPLDQRGVDRAAQSLTIGEAMRVTSLDPQLAQTSTDANVLGDLFMGLVTEDARGAVIPGVAERWTTSADGLTWTFFLRDSSWSDGQALTAYDFEFAFRRLLDPSTRSTMAGVLYFIQGAEEVNTGRAPPNTLGVRAIDARTFEIRINEPAPYFPVVLLHYTAYPIPKHVVEQWGDAWSAPEHFQSNGAFRLARATDRTIELAKNARFFDADDVCLNHVYFRLGEDGGQLIDAVRAHEIGWLREVGRDRIEQLRQEMPPFVRTAAAMHTDYVVFNMLQPPFDDARVRRALAISIDRQDLAGHVMGGGYEPAYQFIPPNMPRYDRARADWSASTLEERRREALSLLQQAGFGPDHPLRFTYIFSSRSAVPVATALQRDWQSLADWIQVDLAPQDAQILYANMRARSFAIGSAGWVSDFADPRNFLYLFETSSGLQNYSGYSNPAFDALMTRANHEPDSDVRAGLLNQAEQIVLRDNPVAAYAFGSSRSLLDPRITGFEDNVADIHRARWMCVRG